MPIKKIEPDVIFVPSEDPVIHAMLQFGGVGPKSRLVDLGCGDGRILEIAARDYRAKSVGYDVDPERVAEARARCEGLDVEVIEGSMFSSDLGKASVVTLYLNDRVNRMVQPWLLSQMSPGARVISQQYDMADWEPDEVITANGVNIFKWTITPRSEG